MKLNKALSSEMHAVNRRKVTLSSILICKIVTFFPFEVWNPCLRGVRRSNTRALSFAGVFLIIKFKLSFTLTNMTVLNKPQDLLCS